MRIAIALIIMALGIALGLWVGVWLMLIGGIVQVVEAVKADPVSSWGIAIGAVKALLASPAGILCALIPLWVAKEIARD